MFLFYLIIIIWLQSKIACKFLFVGVNERLSIIMMYIWDAISDFGFYISLLDFTMLDRKDNVAAIL